MPEIQSYLQMLNCKVIHILHKRLQTTTKGGYFTSLWCVIYLSTFPIKSPLIDYTFGAIYILSHQDCSDIAVRDVCLLVSLCKIWWPLLWGFGVTTQIPDPFVHLPPRQWGAADVEGLLVTKETVTDCDLLYVVDGTLHHYRRLCLAWMSAKTIYTHLNLCFKRPADAGRLTRPLHQ